MSNELVQVPFHGDVIEAVQTPEGVFVPLRRPCEALGIDADGQRKKLKGKAWSRTEMISVPDNRGSVQEVFCLHLESVAMWLATIEPSRVKPEVRPKLELYQKEAARVLAEHFFGRRPAPAVAGGFKLMRLMLDELESQDRRLGAVESRVGVMEDVRGQATMELRAVERSNVAAPPITTRDKINQLVRAYCKATGATHGDVWGRLYRDLFYRCSFNAQLRARNAERPALDCVEEADLLPELFAIASETLVF